MKTFPDQPASRRIAEWTQQGVLRPEDTLEALRLGNALPEPVQWRQFLSLLSLFAGIMALTAGVIFFFAFNWEQMGRFARFGLAQLLVLLPIVIYYRMPADSLAAKGCLLAASILLGALLAVVGQTYQTGADPWQLFFAWAVLIIPWALKARFQPLWLLWMLLLNVSAAAYFQTFGGIFGFLFYDPRDFLFLLLALNGVALVTAEYGYNRKIEWLSSRWGLRLIAIACGGALSSLSVIAVFDFDDRGALSFGLYLLFMTAGFWLWRHRHPDLVLLAAWVLSAIIVSATVIARWVFELDEGAGFFLVSIAVIVMSATGAIWIRGLVQEFQGGEQ